MRRVGKYIVAVAVILGIFALGAAGYWAFSADMPDGLEQTMQNAGIVERESAYNAPLDYEGDSAMLLVMGAIGFFAVLTVTFGVAKMMAKKNETQPDR